MERRGKSPVGGMEAREGWRSGGEEGRARWRAGGRSEGGVSGLLLRTEKFTSIFYSARRKGSGKQKELSFEWPSCCIGLSALPANNLT